MGDVSRLGPMSVKEIVDDIKKRRNDTAAMAARCKPDGDYRKQMEMVVGELDVMLAGCDLLAACKRLLVEVRWEAARADVVTDEARADIALAVAAITKATGTAP